MRTKDELLEYGRNYYHNVYKHKLKKKSRKKRSYDEILQYSRNYYHTVYKHRLNEKNKNIKVNKEQRMKAIIPFSKINNPTTITF